MSEFVAALIGALVGGVATFWATWWQTRRVLAHERQMASEAEAAQRRIKRQEVNQDTARSLMRWLTDFERVLPDIAQGAHVFMDSGRRANGMIEEMRDLQNSSVALLSPIGARVAWAQLRTLVSEFASSWAYVSDGGGDRALSEGWTEQNVSRAQADVESFIQYVRSHLLAIIDGAAPPMPVEHLPVLRRRDMSVWHVEPRAGVEGS